MSRKAIQPAAGRTSLVACFAMIAVLCAADRVAAQVLTPSVFTGPIESATTTDQFDISIEQLKRHVTVLASDTFEGREAGTRGGHAAAAYIVSQLRSSGVQPVPGQGFIQEFGRGYRNLLALIPGEDPALNDEIILVGAHFDHVGYGTKANSNGQVGQIHNGADDNASGVSAMIELARHFQKQPAARPILFAFWDGEEKGLLGSQYWMSAPTVDRRKIRIAFNTDMIGRLRDDLEVLGTRTAAGLRSIVSEANQATDLKLDFNWEIVRDSDHYPFAERGIPFVMFCTKKHEQYHRPDDDIHTLNFAGMAQVTEVARQTIQSLANLKAIPAWRPTARFETQHTKKVLDRIGSRSQPSRLGITYSGSAGQLRIRSVTSSSPAREAGLRPGDLILQFAGQPVVVQRFGAIVQTARNPVEVLFHRPGERQARRISVELNGHPVRFGMQVRDDEAEPSRMVVAKTTPGLPADLAGLKPRDRIRTIGRQSFTTGDDFWKLISGVQQSTTMTIERNGQVREVVLSIRRPQLDSSAIQE